MGNPLLRAFNNGVEIVQNIRGRKEDEMNRMHQSAKKTADLMVRRIDKEEREKIMNNLDNDEEFLRRKRGAEKASDDLLQNMVNDTTEVKTATKKAMNIILTDGLVWAMEDPKNDGVIYEPICAGADTVKDVGKMVKRAIEDIGNDKLTDEELNMSIAVGVAVALNNMQALVDDPNTTKTFMFRKGIENITNALKRELGIDQDKIDNAKEKAKHLKSEMNGGKRKSKKVKKSKKSKKSKRSRRGKKQIKKTKKYKKRSNKKRSNKK